MSKSLYLIYGEDEYRTSLKANELVSSIVPDGDRALGLEIIDGQVDTVDAAVEAVSKCENALRTVGFFGSSKLIWFKNVNFLAENRTGKSAAVKSSLNRLADLIKGGILEGQVLLVTTPKISKRYSFFKACKAVGELLEYAVSEKDYVNEKDARNTLLTQLKNSGLKMSKGAEELFLEKVGTNTRYIVNEIEKLAIYIGDRSDITTDDVDALTSSSRNSVAWDISDAFGHGNLVRALTILRRLMFKNENPIGIVITLLGRVKELMLYREAMDRGWMSVRKSGYSKNVSWNNVPPAIDRMLSEDFDKDPRKGHPFRMGLLAAQAENFSLIKLRKCYTEIVNANLTLVTTSVPKNVVIELLLLKMLA